MAVNPHSPNIDNVKIELIRNGDHLTFKELFYEYYPRLIWFITRYVGDTDDAENIVKELFVELWIRRERFVIHSSLNAYLYASARNRALNYLKSKNRQIPFSSLMSPEEEDLAMVNTSEANPLEQLEYLELDEAVKKAVNSLPARCRLVYTLHKDDKLSYSEIATVMEISVKTVENQMVRAFKLLRAKLSSFIK